MRRVPPKPHTPASPSNRVGWFRFALPLVLSLWLLPYGALHAQMGSGQDWDAFRQLHSDSARAELAEVITRGRDELRTVLHQTLKDAIGEIKAEMKAFESAGLKSGMKLELDLGLGASVSIDVEHFTAVLAWDNVSPPDFPFKAKIESKSTGVGVTKTGSMEIAYDPKAKDTGGVKSVTLEYETEVLGKKDTVSLEVSGTAENPALKVQYGKGFGLSKDFEKEYGFGASVGQSIGLDTARDASQLYDDDMARSDWRIVRHTEDLVAKIVWGVEASLKRDEKVSSVAKVESKVKISLDTDQVRSSYTDWLFKSATQGAEDLNRHLDDQAAWRRGRIEYEAQRLGIEFTDKSNADIIREIHAAWEYDPSLRRPVFRGRDLPDSDADWQAMEEANQRRAEDHRVAQAYFQEAWAREEQRLREHEVLYQQRFQEWLEELATLTAAERAELMKEAGLSHEQVSALEQGLADGWFAAQEIGGVETFACEWGIDFSQLTRELKDSEDDHGWYYVDADDRLHGPEAFWWDSARTRPRGQGCWYEDEKHGWWTMWWVDGHKTSEGRYTHGATVGAWKHWDILDRACSLCDFGDGSTGIASCRPCQTP